MAESKLCYGIEPGCRVCTTDGTRADELVEDGYVYYVTVKTRSDYNGNASYDLILHKDGVEVNTLELNGWKLQNLKYGYDWGATWLKADATDDLGTTDEIRIGCGSGSKSNYQPGIEKVLMKGFAEIKRITETYRSIDLYMLCECTKLYMDPKDLGSYCYELKSMSEFCYKAEEIRKRLRNNPEDKDFPMYESKLKPKLIEYMEKLTHVVISPEKLNP